MSWNQAAFTTDHEARRAIRQWTEKSQQLKQELKTLKDSFQLEPLHPELVGMDAATDEYSPEELIALYTCRRPPRVVDWDTVDQHR